MRFFHRWLLISVAAVGLTSAACSKNRCPERAKALQAISDAMVAEPRDYRTQLSVAHLGKNDVVKAIDYAKTAPKPLRYTFVGKVDDKLRDNTHTDPLQAFHALAAVGEVELSIEEEELPPSSLARQLTLRCSLHF